MAVKTYQEADKVQLSKNFNSYEFRCGLGSPCSCTTVLVDDKLVEYLQKIRDHFGKSVTITSGYRCPSYNKRIGGATGSRHSKGQAADIVVSGVTPREVAKYAESIGVLGIGLYETSADGHFTHIDTRDYKSFWYGQNEAKRTTFGGTPIVEPEKPKVDVSKVDTSRADPEKIWNYFKSKGLNDYGIAGLMGNLEAESAMTPTNLQNSYESKLGMNDAEYTASVDAGVYTNFATDAAGYGLAQWTWNTRKQALLNHCKSKGKSIGDLDAQLDFLYKELTTSYKTSVWNVLTNADSVLEASNAVLLKFEVPADQSTAVQNKRASFGQAFYNKYAKKDEAAPSDPTVSGNGKMKYSSTNRPLVCLQTQSTCYKGTSQMVVKGILWHSTGANNPNLKRYVQPSDDAVNKAEMLKLLGTNTNKNDWNHIERQAGLNAWIGKLADGTVTTVQTMPWNYKPWGCGSGAKGSCNNGWIQFEICEDGLTDRTYFNKVYEEACQITAYLCEMFNIDPHGTVTVNGVNVPTILCHADAHALGLGSNHGDVNHWFPKHGKTMSSARDKVAELMGKKTVIEPAPSENELYRVRKTWEDAKSQIGAYSKLENAKNACDQAGAEYEVYDSKGTAVYPEKEVDNNNSVTVNKIEQGDELKLKANATYSNGREIPSFVFNKKLYARSDEDKNGNVTISTLKAGAITGIVHKSMLMPYNASEIAPGFTTYLVKVTADVLNVRNGPGTRHKIVTQIRQGQVYTIIDESDGWGKLKSGAGWISLEYVKKL